MMCFVVIPQHRSLSASSERKLTKMPAGDATTTTSYCCDPPTLLLSKDRAIIVYVALVTVLQSNLVSRMLPLVGHT
jgi:hypothetical protein